MTTAAGLAGGETRAMEAKGCRYQFRVVVLGDATVGKTSLLRRFVEGAAGTLEPGSELESAPTVGVEFYGRALQLPAGPWVKLQLWDTAGQERFRCGVREGLWVRGGRRRDKKEEGRGGEGPRVWGSIHLAKEAPPRGQSQWPS